jgi:hypothetical protein
MGLAQLRAGNSPLVISSVSTNQPASVPQVILGWNPSPDPNVVGYNLCWGVASGTCTNLFDVGNITNTVVSGFSTNLTYYFTVVAYDQAGDQATPSNEVQFRADTNSISPGPMLNLQSMANSSTISFSFLGSPGHTYVIQATQDFVQWTTLTTTNCSSDISINYAIADALNYPKRFYRVSRQ